MKNYFLHYFADSLFSINDRKEHQITPLGIFEFSFGANDKVLARDSVEEIDGIKVFNGLDFFLRITGENSEYAKNKAKAYTETLLSLMSFASLAYSHSAYIQNIIEVSTDQKNDHVFEYYFHRNKEYECPKDRPLAKINAEVFRNIWSNWENLKEDKLKSRINRSLSWFRKGLKEKGIDEFISYFVGLEILSKALKLKLIH